MFALRHPHTARTRHCLALVGCSLGTPREALEDWWWWQVDWIKHGHIHLRSVEVTVQFCPALVFTQPCWLHIGIIGISLAKGFCVCKSWTLTAVTAHHSSSQMLHHASSYFSITLLLSSFASFGWEKTALWNTFGLFTWFLKECFNSSIHGDS